MSYKPEESKLIAYLYGELSEAERKEVETYLSGNEDAQSELEELKSTLSILGNLKDKQVEAPSFTFQNPKVVSLGDLRLWRLPLSIAASIALLMTVAFFTRFSFSFGEAGVQMAFGKNVETKDATFTQSQVEEMIALAVEKNNHLINEKLELAKNDLISEVSSYRPEINRNLMDNYINQLRRYNAETIGGLLEESETEQRKYTDQVIQDLAIYLDLQRQDDMELIQTRIEDLSEDARRFNRQTGQILTSLLTTDETQNENQY